MNGNLVDQETVLITFGAGAAGWKDAAKRIRKEAGACQLFSEIEIFDEKWIQEYEPALWLQIQKYFDSNLFRGFGYWMWKPALLKWAHEKWPDKQILYVDAGFHIDRDKFLIADFREFLTQSFELGGIAFEQVGLTEECWTKREIFDYFESTDRDKKNNQMYAGFILLPPGKIRAQIISDFYNLTKYREGFLFNDSIELEQTERFLDTRHDQSIFSLLWRKYNLSIVPDLTAATNMKKFLFISARNRTGFSAKTPKYLLKLVRAVNKLRVNRTKYA